MKLQIFKSQRAPGFRLNLLDIAFIGALCALSYFIFKQVPGLTLHLVPLYLGMSFFCFCNIFRIGNRLEPLWYIPFLGLALYSIYTFDMRFFWYSVIIVLEPWKWMLIIYHILRRPYHGIGYQWVNKKRHNCSRTKLLTSSH